MQPIDEKTLEELSHLIETSPKIINFLNLIQEYILPEPFLYIAAKELGFTKFKDILQHQKVSETFIKNHLSQTQFWIKYAICYQDLSEEFIRTIPNNDYEWDLICQNQKLSVNFIKEFYDKMYWLGLSLNKNLTEEIIREFYNKMDIEKIISHSEKYINLSEEFIQTLKVWS